MDWIYYDCDTVYNLYTNSTYFKTCFTETIGGHVDMEHTWTSPLGFNNSIKRRYANPRGVGNSKLNAYFTNADWGSTMSGATMYPIYLLKWLLVI